jgi:hypothetical protein
MEATWLSSKLYHRFSSTSCIKRNSHQHSILHREASMRIQKHKLVLHKSRTYQHTSQRKHNYCSSYRACLVGYIGLYPGLWGSYAELHIAQSKPNAAVASTTNLIVLGNVGLHRSMEHKKKSILTSPTSTRNMRPLLEHGGNYMQDNVSNQTQFHQMQLACAGQPNTKTIQLRWLGECCIKSNASTNHTLTVWQAMYSKQGRLQNELQWNCRTEDTI